jgi:hypothetical protein
MKLTQKSGAGIAMTAAALIISGATLIGAANAETFKGRCFGVNGCKAHARPDLRALPCGDAWRIALHSLHLAPRS